MEKTTKQKITALKKEIDVFTGNMGLGTPEYKANVNKRCDMYQELSRLMIIRKAEKKAGI